jgi:YVTN family beta-propeller protein
MSEFLPAPENVTPLNTGLSWKKVPGATHYKIYTRLATTTDYTTLATVTAGNPLTALQTYLHAWQTNVLQYVAVSAVIDDGDVQIESSPSPEAMVFSAPPRGGGSGLLAGSNNGAVYPDLFNDVQECTVRPSKPRGLRAIAVAPDSVDITWFPPDQPAAENIYGNSLWYMDPTNPIPNQWLPANVINGLPLPIIPPATTPPPANFIQATIGARIQLLTKWKSGKQVEYLVRVGSHSECGEAYSDSIAAMPATTDFGPASNVTATPAGGGVIVNWQSQNIETRYNTRDPITGQWTTTYRRTPVPLADIYYTTDLSQPWQLSLKDARISTDGVFIPGLSPNTNYIFAVQRKSVELGKIAIMSQPTPPVMIGPWIMIGQNAALDAAARLSFYTRYTPNNPSLPHYPLDGQYVPTASSSVLPFVTTKHITGPSLPAGGTIASQGANRIYQLSLTGNTLLIRQGGPGLYWTLPPSSQVSTVVVGRGSDAYPLFRGMTTTLEGVFNADGRHQPGQKVFVVNSGDGTISVVDVATSTVTDTIDIKTVGRTELFSGISYDTSTNMLYVTERNYGTVKAINATTKQIVGSIDLGVPLYDVCVHKSRQKIYIATENAGIKVINLTTSINFSGATVSTIVLPSDGIYGYGKTRGLYLCLSETRDRLLAGGRNNPEDIISVDTSGAPLRTLKNGSLFLIDCATDYITGKKNFYGNVTGVGIDETGLAYCVENSYIENGTRMPSRIRAYDLNAFSREVGIGYYTPNIFNPALLSGINTGTAPGQLHIGPYQDNGAFMFVSPGKPLTFPSRPRDARWQHGCNKVLLGWNPPAAPWPTNFGGYHVFSRLSSAATSNPANPYVRARIVPPQENWIEVTHHAGVPLENDKAYDFRVMPYFTQNGNIIGYGQPLSTFTNIVPRQLWNLNAVRASTVLPSIKSMYTATHWSSIALPAAVYNALADTLDFNGCTINLVAQHLPGTWWAATCNAGFAIIITAKGGFVVPISCTITHNTAVRTSGIIAAHELGHALGIGTSSMWVAARTSQLCDGNKWFLDGTVFKNAFAAYMDWERQRDPNFTVPLARIPLLSSWPAGGEDGSVAGGAVGSHWAHNSTQCAYRYPAPGGGDMMSYSTVSGTSQTTTGALLDMGFRVCSPTPFWRNHFMENAERPSPTAAMSMQAEPVWVPNETPQEILPEECTCKVGGCVSSAHIIGTLYLDGTAPTDA